MLGDQADGAPGYLMTGNSVYNLRKRSKAFHFPMKDNEEP